MKNHGVSGVKSLSPSALTPELIGQIERAALSETAPLAPRCRKILRMLRKGAEFERIQGELGRIQQALTIPAAETPGVAGELTAALTPSGRSPALDAVVTELRAAVSAARMAVLRRKLFLTVREAAEYSGLPLCSIRRMIAYDLLPAVKAGGWRIKRAYLEMLDLRHLRRLAENRTEKTQSAPARRALNGLPPPATPAARRLAAS